MKAMYVLTTLLKKIRKFKRILEFIGVVLLASGFLNHNAPFFLYFSITISLEFGSRDKHYQIVRFTW